MLLSAQPLKFQKTRLIGCELGTPTPTQLLLGAVSCSTKTLHLVGYGNRELKSRPCRKVSLPWALKRLFSNITLRAFCVLESLAFRMSNVGIRGARFTQLLDSISSPQFSVFILDIRDRESRLPKSGDVKKLLDEVKMMDSPLCRFATNLFEGTGKRFMLILIGNNPAAITCSLTKFCKVGNTWEGEKVIGGGRYNHYWTFWPAKGWETKGIDKSVLSFVDV